jgi:hypothetical protein
VPDVSQREYVYALVAILGGAGSEQQQRRTTLSKPDDLLGEGKDAASL